MQTIDVLTELQQARIEGREARIKASDLPQEIDAAYAQVLGVVPHPAAWKIGGANPWSQKVFNNTDPFYGALRLDEVIIEPEPVHLYGLVAPLAEPEIMLEIADSEQGRFSRMGLGVEIPASVLPAEAKGALAGQILDRAGAGALWIGGIRPFDQAELTGEFETEFVLNDGEAIKGAGTNVLGGGPVGAATRFLDLARAAGAPLASGQWIASGGLSPAVPVSIGDHILVRGLDTSVEIAFR